MMSHHPASILLVLLLAFGTVLSEEGGTICSSVDVRNTVGDLEQLSGCRVVEGFVRVVLIDKANASDYDGISFPQLREITDYLLFYRAAGLLSLGSLFPNLTVIRGNSLFVDYALVVYDMMHITELGLGSLTTILRGSVRIENNRHLCFLQSVDWKSIIVHGELYATNNNPEQVLCPACPAACEDHHCWGQSVCQKVPQKDDDGCDEQCLGGCSGPGPDRCSACTRVVDENGICAQNCPPDRFEFMGRRCVTEEQCRASEVPSVHLQRTVLPGLPSKAWIPFNGSCCLMCPLGYQPVLNEHGKHTCERCVGYCRKVCGSGDRIPVESIFHIQQLNGCTYINGSLIVRLLMGKQILQELEDNLDGIEEISGFLKVYFSYPLTSLNFFKKLRVIHGTDLENGQFALVIVRNDNLQELWNWESRPKNFTIKNGTLSIHSNPKLCMSEVDEFLHIAGFHNDSAVEISLESNGNNIACRPIKMAAHVTVINSTSAQVEWGSFRDARNLLGFIVHYKETRDENVTLHKDFDECEDDDWRVAYVILNSQTTNMSHVITQLKPFTLYAFYVETYSTVSATVGGRSSIQFFRTFPDRPSIPRYLRAYSNSSSEVVLHWQPPLFPNGEISHYIIVGWRHYDDRILLEQRDYCRFPLEPRKKEDEEQLLLNQPEVKDSCCKPATCMSNDDARFNFIYTQEAVNEEQGPCEQQTSIYSVLYSHRLYGNGGGIYDTHGDFQQQTEGNSTTALVSDLHHFAEYTIKVVACRKSHLGTINHAWNDSHCSPASLITTRTRKLEAADDVDSSLVKVEVSSGGTVRVFWLEPSHPNGIVVSYHVEYRRTDIVNFEPVFLCLTSLQFERAKNWYVLNNMAPGKYSIRIRATSLAGDSSFTDFVEFAVRQEVVPRSYKSEIIILSTVILTLFAVLSGLTFCFWKKLKSESEMAHTIVTSLNPDYMSLAVYEPDEWEIVRDKVDIIRELSRGTFGVVYEGVLRPANVRCAIKTVDEKASVRERIEFLNEASVMKSFSGGHHVVKLFGVVSRGQPPLVVMELMALGDLKSFLREARGTCCMTLSEVLRMAAEIADGMAYLEASKFVHRDLAARNCMLTQDATVKIGDFGMTRDVYQRDYYRKGNRGLLPVRWMAPESLADGVFTNQSDVWSYGVVLWEIATLAEQPYQGLSNEQVLQYVLRGHILDKPVGCPELLYRLMLACWQKRPAHRPTFLKLVRVLDAITDVGDEFRQASFYHSQEASLQKDEEIDEYVNMDGTEEQVDGEYVLGDFGS